MILWLLLTSAGAGGAPAIGPGLILGDLTWVARVSGDVTHRTRHDGDLTYRTTE